MKYLIVFLLSATFIVISSGFFVFTRYASLSYNIPQFKQDAIVVFTGDSGRLFAGFQLLHLKKAEKLFISGAKPKVNLKQIIEASGTLYPPSEQNINCCVRIGSVAKNTIQNIKQTNLWAEQAKIGQVILVTSDYHMPRSRIIFFLKHSKLDVSSFPVQSSRFSKNWFFNPDKVGLALHEYAKIIATVIVLFPQWIAGIAE